MQKYHRGPGGSANFGDGNWVQSGLLCYPKCRLGFVAVGPVCWASCPPGFTDIGVGCQKPAAYGRGVGRFCVFSCNCRSDEDRWGVSCYPKCRSGYHNVACCICSPNCPSGFTDTGADCTKPSYGNGVGRSPYSVATILEITGGVLVAALLLAATGGMAIAYFGTAAVVIPVIVPVVETEIIEGALFYTISLL